MKNGHTAVNEFMGKKERFADFFNGNLFGGEQIVLPDELEIVKGESDILLEDKNQNVKNIHRYRDIVMRWKKEIYLVILACELQSKVHYAMPVRKMSYDSLSYLDQAKRIWESRSDKNEKLSGAEYLSRFRKEDKLVPVITAVFYYGTDKWDGSTDLYGMFDDNLFINDELIRKYIPNYWINLVEVDNMESVECFQTDLREIFGMMKCRKDKDALVRYMREHGDYFQHVDTETYYAIGELLQSKRILSKEVKRSEEEGEMDMCKALEDLYQDGREEGREEGRESKLRELVEKKIQKGYSISEIADMLEEEESVIAAILETRGE